jgi:hypothetical protein
VKVVFTAEIDVSSEDLEKADNDTMQAIQNIIGHSGAQVDSIEFEDV